MHPSKAGPTSNTWFLGQTPVSPQNGISIGSAIFAQLTRVPNTQTDIQTTLRAIYVTTDRSVQAMLPKMGQRRLYQHYKQLQ